MKKKNGFLVILIILSAFISIEMPIAILMKSPPALIGVLFVFSIFLAVMWFICILIKNRRGASSSKNESGAESPITPAPTGRAPTAPAPSGRAPTALAPKEIVYLYDKYAATPATIASKKMLASAGIKLRKFEAGTDSITLVFNPR